MLSRTSSTLKRLAKDRYDSNLYLCRWAEVLPQM